MRREKLSDRSRRTNPCPDTYKGAFDQQSRRDRDDMKHVLARFEVKTDSYAVTENGMTPGLQAMVFCFLRGELACEPSEGKRSSPLMNYRNPKQVQCITSLLGSNRTSKGGEMVFETAAGGAGRRRHNRGAGGEGHANSAIRKCSRLKRRRSPEPGIARITDFYTGGAGTSTYARGVGGLAGAPARRTATEAPAGAPVRDENPTEQRGRNRAGKRADRFIERHALGRPRTQTPTYRGGAYMPPTEKP
ncbi:hypothetical protein EVAR_19428_1 [Eumeta japonica]|uniref:Uncharacterized protein n=1 Tax=Eumeta variegata TaxID=151549 RepID=A0A4C1TRL5_EUMVA|nr:hypothetical protein EVAR_19428_1 [Eumeta japonica]